MFYDTIIASDDFSLAFLLNMFEVLRITDPLEQHRILCDITDILNTRVRFFRNEADSIKLDIAIKLRDEIYKQI